MKNNDQKIESNMNSIKYKILVLSNKGGVGKSTVSANIAAGLVAKGFKVGMLDADLHGPSQAKIFGVENIKFNVSGTQDDMQIEPLKISDNFKLATTAAIIESPDAPLIWRGPLKMTLIKQFLGDVTWGELDFLVIDAPPGTGDEPLTILQAIKKVDLVVIVTTPQEIALLDSKKAVNFIKQFDVQHVGIVENMAEFTCPHCGGKVNYFSQDGGRLAAKEMAVDFFGSIAFDKKVMEAMESGQILNLAKEALFDEVINNITTRLK